MEYRDGRPKWGLQKLPTHCTGQYRHSVQAYKHFKGLKNGFMPEEEKKVLGPQSKRRKK